MTVQIATTATVPIVDDGLCVRNCEDFYATTIRLSNTWTMHELAWRSLSQEGWGTPAAFAPETILFFEFAFDVGASFDLYIDDLAFY